eukprot:TRINITY_DN850_c1_g2_i1.p1 TRINITY_DN850_c1_g2~~TRINITY_DN850_c1_g2_i1.p1  ORF type:complete len:208 (-),score=43.94 TRINITY_DN850_c1_g2_i1:721-1251(-)
MAELNVPIYDFRMSPHLSLGPMPSGRAVVVLKKCDVDAELEKFWENVVFLDGRPVVVRPVGQYPDPVTETEFPGHMQLESFRIKGRREGEHKHAVATSHTSQPNTLEYDLGLGWRRLYEEQCLEVQELIKVHEEEVRQLEQKFERMNRGEKGTVAAAPPSKPPQRKSLPVAKASKQ